MPNCDQLWFAFIGPDSTPLGEIKTVQQLYQNQVAATLAALLGIEWNTNTGKVIGSAVRK